MPKVYPPGAKLPELAATVSGGIAVHLHDPSEVDGLLAVLDWGARPPEGPLKSAYRSLSDPALDLEAWADRWREEHPIANEDGPTFVEPRTEIGKLKFALEAVRELWKQQPDADAKLLNLVVMLAEPLEGGRKGEVLLVGRGAALTVQPGSLWASVIRLPVRGTIWVVCLVAGGGTSTSARSTGMVERLRRAQAPGADPLPDIRGQIPGNGRPLAVLVHGLFATDVGTFKELQKGLAAVFDVVGFPHDTLSQSIDFNAKELVEVLAALRWDKPVVLVAHSRGGLVCRSAAQRLSKFPGHGINIAGCATFGTPHIGAELAENPGELVAAIAFAKSAGDLSVAGVLDMLCCMSERDMPPGIADLRPGTTEERWLHKFTSQEGLLVDSNMPLFAVGGTFVPNRRLQHLAKWTVQRLIGQQDSDLVVSRRSSCPRVGKSNSMTRDVSCNHFGYFGPSEAKTHDAVIKWLSERVGDAARKNAKKS
jgi:pimeloyl-ACP methyl ester carboxylesterase